MKILVWYLTWCPDAVFDNIADELPEKLVRRMMKIFKKQQNRAARKALGASEFFVEIR